MMFEEQWVANESQLIHEADSLGELFARLSDRFEALPIDDQVWEALLNRSLDLPPTLAGFPLWLGFPVDESEPNLILNVSLPGGTQSASHFAKKKESKDSSSAAACTAALLRETGQNGSPLQGVVGNRVLLEYPIDPTRDEQDGPGSLLYPVHAALAGDPSGSKLDDIHLTVDAAASAMNRQLSGSERNLIGNAYMALPPSVRVGAVGAFPSRGRMLRIALLGFRNAMEVESVLARVGLTDHRSAVADMLKRLAACGCLSQMQLGIRFDIGAEGVEPSIELQIFSANTIYDSVGWFKDAGCWTQLIRGIGESGLASPQKLAGLDSELNGVQLIFGRTGPLILIRRIHHFTVVLNRDHIEQVNAYAFVLLTRLPKQSK